MSRSPQMPQDAVILRTYAELAAEADAYFGDHYDELLVVGPPGDRQVGDVQAGHSEAPGAVPLHRRQHQAARHLHGVLAAAPQAARVRRRGGVVGIGQRQAPACGNSPSTRSASTSSGFRR